MLEMMGRLWRDARKVSIMECLLNSVNVEWSTNKTLPGTNATVSVTAEPLSLCSLGVVDKSVSLLITRKFLLTVKRLLQLAQRSSVGSWDYRQVDDYRYCEEQQTDKPPTNYTDTTIPTTATPPTTEPTVPPSSSPERRKKRSVLPSRDGSDSLRRSERSIIIGPWWPPFYNYDDVDALYMCDVYKYYIYII
ncbi:hypothetical protein Avbf_13602 [Armadillidium vulgare]|nr:hypothetical protein Avbf_13602 [Armadillidium vulgare]